MSFTDEHKLETYKSLISVSIEGLKTLLLVNGGAVVALLAFMGQSIQGAQLASHAALPLAGFVVGVFSCVLAFAGAYCTQYALFNEAIGNPTGSRPMHMTFFWATSVFVVISLGSFGYGAFESIYVLAQHGSSSPARLAPLNGLQPMSAASIPTK